MITHKQTVGVASSASQNISGSVTESGSSESVIDTVIGGGLYDQALAISITASAMQSLFLVSNQPVVMKVNGVNEVQQISITGTPTGGSFTVTFSGQTTAAIPYNSIASAVASAIQALSNVGAVGVTTTGGPLPGTPVAVTFGGPLARQNVAAMTTTDSLTGGSSPASSVSTTTGGVAPDETINLVAGAPLMWSRSSGYFANPFSGNVSSFFFTTTAAATIQGRVLSA